MPKNQSKCLAELALISGAESVAAIGLTLMALLTFSTVAAGGKSRTARTWRVVANVVAAAGVGLSLWLDPPWAAALTAVVAIGAVIAVFLAAHGDYAYVTAKLDDETRSILARSVEFHENRIWRMYVGDTGRGPLVVFGTIVFDEREDELMRYRGELVLRRFMFSANAARGWLARQGYLNVHVIAIVSDDRHIPEGLDSPDVAVRHLSAFDEYVSQLP